MRERQPTGVHVHGIGFADLDIFAVNRTYWISTPPSWEGTELVLFFDSREDFAKFARSILAACDAAELNEAEAVDEATK